MTSKEIKFWLSRLSSEYITQIRKLLEQIGVHDHQILHYDTMREEVREEVREELYLNMQHLGWNKEVEELKQQLGEKL